MEIKPKMDSSIMFAFLSKNPMVIKHTGLQTCVALSRSYFDKCLWPLTNIIWKKNQIRRNSPGSSRRTVVGLSGGGGCGKTFLAAMLQQALSLMFQQAHEKATCIVLGMDGYHFPNSYLREHNLAHIKGRPPSLDVHAFLQDLKRLQKKGLVSLPIYDRKLHEPVADAILANDETEIVIVEGLYVLHQMKPTWCKVRDHLHFGIFLTISESLSRRRLIDRKPAFISFASRRIKRTCTTTICTKMACGYTEEKARELFERNDKVTRKELLTSSAPFADLILEFDQHQHAKTSPSSLVGAATLPPDQPIPTPHLVSVVHRWVPAPSAPTAGLFLPTTASGVGVPEDVTLAASTSAPSPPIPHVSNILVLGLNPALQKTLSFDGNWRRGRVNRGRALVRSIGGKGQQVAHGPCINLSHLHACCPWSLAIDQLGYPHVKVMIAQFLGGSAGAALERIMRDEMPRVQQLTQHTDCATRTCLTLLGADTDATTGEVTTEATEIIEPSEPIPHTDVAALHQEVSTRLSTRQVAGVAISGSLPPGVTPEFYAKTAQEARRAGARVLLDGVKGVRAALDTKCVDVLKVNVEELQCLAQTVAQYDELDSFPYMQVAQAATIILKRFPVQNVAITDGGRRAYLFSQGGSCALEYRLPTSLTSKIVNPIGAGDTVSAVLLTHWVDQRACDLPGAMADGLAAGTASCFHMHGSAFAIDDACVVRRGILVHKIMHSDTVCDNLY